MEEVEKRRAARAAEAARRRFLEQTQVMQRQLPRPILPPSKPLSSSIDATAVVAAAVQQQVQQDEDTYITEEGKDAAVAAISEAASLTENVMVSQPVNEPSLWKKKLARQLEFTCVCLFRHFL